MCGGGGGVRGGGTRYSDRWVEGAWGKRMELFSLFLSDTRDAGSRHCTGKTGEMENTFFFVRESTGDLSNLPKHRENAGNFAFSICQFPES